MNHVSCYCSNCPSGSAVFKSSGIYFGSRRFCNLFHWKPNVNSMVFAQQVLAGSQGLSLLAIPFFVMAGVFMNYTGVTRRIMECCNVLTSRWYGGLAQVNVLLSTLMGGLSGSSLADAAMECKNARSVHGSRGIFKTVLHGNYRSFRNDRSVNSAGNWTYHLCMYL